MSVLPSLCMTPYSYTFLSSIFSLSILFIICLSTTFNFCLAFLCLFTTFYYILPFFGIFLVPFFPLPVFPKSVSIKSITFTFFLYSFSLPAFLPHFFLYLYFLRYCPPGALYDLVDGLLQDRVQDDPLHGGVGGPLLPG